MSIYLIGWVARHKNKLDLNGGQTAIRSLDYPTHANCMAAVKHNNPEYDKVAIVSVIPISSRNYEIYISEISTS